MGTKPLVPSTSRTDSFNPEAFATGQEQITADARIFSSLTSLKKSELESGREKHEAHERRSPFKSNKVKASKIMKSSVSPRAVSRKVQGPVIIHTSSPKVIRTDPSNFMLLVQKLTGSSSTRSRCKNSRPQGGSDQLRADTGTPCAAVETVPTELFLAETIVSKTSSFDDSITLQSGLQEALFGFQESPNAALVEDDASPKGLLPPIDSICSTIRGDEPNPLSVQAASFQSSSYPVCVDIVAGIFAVPDLQPIRDSFVSSLPVRRNKSCDSLFDLGLLSPA